MKNAIVLLAVVAVAIGGFFWINRPKEVPDLELRNSAGDVVRLSQLRGDKAYLVGVFMLPGCAFSKHSLSLLGPHVDRYRESLQFVGFSTTDQKGAEQLRESEGVPFPVYGLKSASDLVLVNDLMATVGHGSRSRPKVWGGTVFLMDEVNKVHFSLEKEGVDDDLADQLAKFGW